MILTCLFTRNFGLIRKKETHLHPTINYHQAIENRIEIKYPLLLNDEWIKEAEAKFC
jgi:hypothetical protein